MTHIKKSVLIPALLLYLAFMIIGLLLYNGILWFNNPSEREYPVRGVDVSAYQGLIDWTVLAKGNITFAFIKATEGSGFVDMKFKDNWEQASKTQLYIGAYHFFSFDSPGQTQADHYIKTVTKTERMLPPVVDVEFYGDKATNLPDKEATQTQLKALLAALEAHYGVKPIIYATQTSYSLYIKDTFVAYPLWIRSVYSGPSLPQDQSWTFWQYSDHGRLDGYDGPEKYIDLNIFNGSAEDFQKFIGNK